MYWEFWEFQSQKIWRMSDWGSFLYGFCQLQLLKSININEARWCIFGSIQHFLSRKRSNLSLLLLQWNYLDPVSLPRQMLLGGEMNRDIGVGKKANNENSAAPWWCKFSPFVYVSWWCMHVQKVWSLHCDSDFIVLPKALHPADASESELSWATCNRLQMPYLLQQW